MKNGLQEPSVYEAGTSKVCGKMAFGDKSTLMQTIFEIHTYEESSKPCKICIIWCEDFKTVLPKKLKKKNFLIFIFILFFCRVGESYLT